MRWRARSLPFARFTIQEGSRAVSRGLKLTIGILTAMVVVGLVTLPGLRRAIQRLQSATVTEQQARREALQAPISTPTDVKAAAEMYWLAPPSLSSLAASTVQIPLSADPAERSKQLIAALITMAPAPERRTLPPDAALLGFYITPDGTGVADFSDDLQAGIPSGILSEQLAVESIVQTLGANKTGIQKLKILIHGQGAETLAGHLDLSGFFSVPPAGSATAQKAPPTEGLPGKTPAPTAPAASAKP